MPAKFVRNAWKPFDDEIVANASKFDKARQDGKPFFLLLRMHVVTHLSEKYENMRTPENGWTIQEAGMAQLDDIVGSVMKYLRDNGLESNTILAFSRIQRGRSLRCRSGQTPFAEVRGSALGRLPRSDDHPLAWQDTRWQVENSLVSGLDWFPTLVAAAGNRTSPTSF